jgi:hypothetical protein
LQYHLSLLFVSMLIGTLWLDNARATESTVSTSEPPSFFTILKTHARDLAAITSDSQASELFSSRIGPAFDLKETVALLTGKTAGGSLQRRKLTDATASQDLSAESVRLIALMATWQVADKLNQTAGDAAALQLLMRETASQREWLTGHAPSSYFGGAIQLAAILSAQPDAYVPSSDSPSGFPAYAARLSQAMPKLTGGEESWTTVAEHEGLEGMTRRLLAETEGLSESDRQRFAAIYFHTRLRPVFTAHMTALLIRAQVDAEQHGLQTVQRLRDRQTMFAERRGIGRLCGTWQWTVHNHQNHQDHKFAMSFPPPETSSPGMPRPAKIVVLGDTVYLRWEFERGIVQEDSLLFGGEGQRLEGTFVNSAGPWGGIAAKRVAACSRTDAPAPATSLPDAGNSPRSRGPSRR